MDDSRVSLPSDALTASAPGARRVPPSKMTEGAPTRARASARRLAAGHTLTASRRSRPALLARAEDRRRLAERTLRQFPNRVPVVLQKSPKCRLTNVPTDDYVVVPDDWTLGKFISALRKRISLSPTDGTPRAALGSSRRLAAKPPAEAVPRPWPSQGCTST